MFITIKRSMRLLLVLVTGGFCALVAAANTASLNYQQHRLQVDTREGGVQIQVSDDKKNQMQVRDIAFNYQTAVQWEIRKADDKHIELQGSFAPSVEFYRTVDDNKARRVSLTIRQVEGGFHLHASPDWGRQVTLELADLKDHIFGLSEPLQPDNRLSPDLRKGVITVDVTAEEASFQENYASAFSAFFISSLGYGSFFDTFARGTYHIGINGAHRIHHETGALDWYLFFGDDGAEIHKAYFSLIGKPKSVPAWGLGPIGWRDQNDGGADEILEDIERLTQMQMPFTSWFVDRPYSDGAHAWSQMNFREDFANPEQWIAKIREHYGMEFMTWTSPAFFGATPFNRHLAGDFSYIDLSDTESVEAFKQALVEKQLNAGVKGHKIDRADERFPATEAWQDESVAPAERRNRYAYLMAKVHDEALRSVWEDDQITFARSAIHRTQPYLSAIWGGDPRTTWEGLRANFANAARSSFMGFPVWGTDVGGYQGEGYIPEDLHLRWMQAGSMTGLFEIKLDGAGGDGRDRMPWQYDEDFQNTFRAILDDRMWMIPYLYSLAETSYENGTLMQPLAYRHLNDANTYDNWDTFYVGEAILVAPVFEPATKRRVYLPKGNWRDFDDAAVRFKGGKFVTVDAPLSKLPRFVRENSLFVTGNLFPGNSTLWQESSPLLKIHAYPGARGSQSRFTYVDMLDDDKHKEITLERTGNNVRIKSPAVGYARQFEIVLNAKPKTVTVNGVSVTPDYHGDKKRLLVKTDVLDAVTVDILM
ncbi:MAG TPA: TIM-barrel domain-containing protein [Cellvibrionaceae bacterium]